MAWDALGNIFQRKQQQREQDKTGFSVGQTSGSRAAPSASNAPFLNGVGGSAGAPVSSGFVNFGTLYDLNKEKAGQMAQGVYNKAQSDVDAAKGKLDAAKNTFNQRREQGAGTWKPIQGKHGTEIIGQQKPAAPAPSNKVTGTSAPGGRDVSNATGLDVPVTPIQPGGPITLGSSLQGAVKSGEQKSPAGAGTMGAGASRYGSLYGPASAVGGWSPDVAQNAQDYNHAVTELDAKSGAGQQYTGPDSLKDSMGDEEYGKLMDELASAERGTENLTNAGGIATALGYEPFQDTGKSDLDTALTQVAGQSNFKALADKTKGLKDTLGQAQWDSIGQAGTAGADSAAAAKEWQDLLAEYEAEQNKPGPITIGAANDRLGPNAGTDKLAKPGPGWDELQASGYSMQEINDIYDSLTTEEKLLLSWTKDQRNTAGAVGGNSAATIWQNIIAKLDAARKNKKG